MCGMEGASNLWASRGAQVVMVRYLVFILRARNGQREREVITFILREDLPGACMENDWPAWGQRPLSVECKRKVVGRDSTGRAVGKSEWNWKYCKGSDSLKVGAEKEVGMTPAFGAVVVEVFLRWGHGKGAG